MYKQTANVVKSVGMGMLAGAAVATVSKKMMSGPKNGNMKKAAGKAMHSVGELVMDVEKMLK